MIPDPLRRWVLIAGMAAASWLGGCASVQPPGDAAPVVSTAAPPTPAPAPVPVTTVPEPAIVLLDSANASLRLAGEDMAARRDLWQRVRGGFAMNDLDGELVQKWEQWYASRPDYVQRMTERGGRYLFHIVEEVDRRGMPFELALLPFIESAFNPQALSVARAAGMWQFMPATGRDFALAQNLFRDERRDVLASTRAALDYLQQLQRQFNDWQLALAAYNWGPGNVQRALERNRRAGLGTRYEDLRMPDETRNYVPKLQAVKNLVARPEAFAINLPPLQNHPFFVAVQIERDIDVALAARLAGLTIDEFQQLNPQHNKPVILAAGSPQVLLPYDNANQFLRALDGHRGPLASWTAWIAPETLSAAAAARRVGMPEADLREVNRIPPSMLVQAGSTLLVPRSAHVATDVAEAVADHARIVFAPLAPPPRRVSFKAGKGGETVAAVARRHGVSAASVARWNNVGVRSSFKAGETIVVMLAPSPAKAAAPKRSARRAAAPAAKAPRAAARGPAARPQRTANR